MLIACLAVDCLRAHLQTVSAIRVQHRPGRIQSVRFARTGHFWFGRTARLAHRNIQSRLRLCTARTRHPLHLQHVIGYSKKTDDCFFS